MKVHVSVDPVLPPRHLRVIGTDLSGVRVIRFAGRDATPARVRQESGGSPRIMLGAAVRQRLGLPDECVLHARLVDGCLNLGPCLALYADKGTGSRIFNGQTALFTDLARLGSERGVAVTVLVPGDWTSRQAYWWQPGGWRRGPLQQPDLVLRRSGMFAPARFAAAWCELDDLRERGLLHTLPRECSDKWHLYETLRDWSSVRDHLPHTTLAGSADEVWERARQTGDVYVKPIHGAQGRHVVRLQSSGRRQLRLLRHRADMGSGAAGEIIEETVDAGRWSAWCAQYVHGPSIVQDTVHVVRTSDDRPVDFRWLVQWAGDTPQVVARVARVGLPGAVTTNIHTGADPVWAEEALVCIGYAHTEATARIACMDELALDVARRLRDRFGPYAECGLDLVLDTRGQIYLLEVNPTPGRRMLRRLDPAVRWWSLDLLLEYAIRASGFAD